MLERKHIADWIRARASEVAAARPNGPGVLVTNIYTGLRMSVKGNPLGPMMLACNAISLARLIGIDIVEEAVTTNERKGKDYAPGSDILENFYRVADVTGVSAVTVWGVYVTKHVEAIRAFVLRGRLESEPIDSRLVDVLVYAALGYFILEREKGEGVTL